MPKSLLGSLPSQLENTRMRHEKHSCQGWSFYEPVDSCKHWVSAPFLDAVQQRRILAGLGNGLRKQAWETDTRALGHKPKTRLLCTALVIVRIQLSSTQSLLAGAMRDENKDSVHY